MKVVNDEYGRPILKFVSTGIISSPEGPRLGFKAKNVGNRALDVHFGLRPMLGRITQPRS